MAEISAQEVFEMIRDDKYDVDIPRTYNIRLMIDIGLGIAETLLTMNWDFVAAPKEVPFITSDVPFTTAPPPGHEGSYGVLTPGAMSTVPLSDKTCLVLSGEGGRLQYGGIPKDAARTINNNVAMNSDRFVIARDRPFLEKVVARTRIDQYVWRSRYAFNARPDPDDPEGRLLLHARKRTAP
jgi:hypothetical protein